MAITVAQNYAFSPETNYSGGTHALSSMSSGTYDGVAILVSIADTSEADMENLRLKFQNSTPTTTVDFGPPAYYYFPQVSQDHAFYLFYKQNVTLTNTDDLAITTSGTLTDIQVAILCLNTSLDGIAHSTRFTTDFDLVSGSSNTSGSTTQQVTHTTNSDSSLLAWIHHCENRNANEVTMISGTEIFHVDFGNETSGAGYQIFTSSGDKTVGYTDQDADAYGIQVFEFVEYSDPTITLETTDGQSFSDTTPTIEFSVTSEFPVFPYIEIDSANTLNSLSSGIGVGYGTSPTLGTYFRMFSSTEADPGTYSYYDDITLPFVAISSGNTTGINIQSFSSYAGTSSFPLRVRLYELDTHPKNPSGTFSDLGTLLATASMDSSDIPTSGNRTFSWDSGTPALTKGNFYVLKIEMPDSFSYSYSQYSDTDDDANFVWFGTIFSLTQGATILTTITPGIGLNQNNLPEYRQGYLNFRDEGGTFENIDTPADTEPFAGGDTLGWTSDSAMTEQTWYYRVGAIDVFGNTVFSSVRSFTISSASPISGSIDAPDFTTSAAITGKGAIAASIDSPDFTTEAVLVADGELVGSTSLDFTNEATLTEGSSVEQISASIDSPDFTTEAVLLGQATIAGATTLTFSIPATVQLLAGFRIVTTSRNSAWQIAQFTKTGDTPHWRASGSQITTQEYDAARPTFDFSANSYPNEIEIIVTSTDGWGGLTVFDVWTPGDPDDGGSQIRELHGLHMFTNLTTLVLRYCKLKTLDLSALTNLTSFWLRGKYQLAQDSSPFTEPEYVTGGSGYIQGFGNLTNLQYVQIDVTGIDQLTLPATNSIDDFRVFDDPWLDGHTIPNAWLANLNTNGLSNGNIQIQNGEDDNPDFNAYSDYVALTGKGWTIDVGLKMPIDSSVDIDFTTSADLEGTGEIEGSTSLDFTNQATLTEGSSVEQISASIDVDFTTSATLVGKGAMAAATTLDFTVQITGRGRGALAGISNVTQGTNGQLKGKGHVVPTSGGIAFTIATLNDIHGHGELQGATTLTFTTSAATAGTGLAASVSVFDFTTSATLTGIGALRSVQYDSYTDAGTKIYEQDFSSGLGDFVNGNASAGSIALDNERVKITNDGAADYPYAVYPNFPTIIGRKYVIGTSLTYGTHDIGRTEVYGNGVELVYQNQGWQGVLELEFTANDTSVELRLYCRQTGNTGEYLFYDDIWVSTWNQVFFATSATLTAKGEVEATTDLTFSTSNATTGLGELVAETSLDFTASATMEQGAIEGSTSLDFTTSATITGAGELEAATTLDFTTSGTLTGKAELQGQTSLDFAPTGEMAASGALLGESSITMSTACQSVGTGAILASTTLTFTGQATFDQGAIEGATTLTFSGVQASLLGYGQLIGSASFTFSQALDVLGRAQIGGATTLDFTQLAEIGGLAEVYGETTFTFTSFVEMFGNGAAEGSILLEFVSASTLNAFAEVLSQIQIDFSSVADLSGITGDGPIDGSTSLTFTTAADLSGLGALTGSETITFTELAALEAFAETEGATTLTFTIPDAEMQRFGFISGSTSLDMTASAQIKGAGEISATIQIDFEPLSYITGKLYSGGTISLNFTTEGEFTAGIRIIAGSTYLNFTTNGAFSNFIPTTLCRWKLAYWSVPALIYEETNFEINYPSGIHALEYKCNT